MTNFSGAPAGPISRERVLRWGPALVGGVLAALVGGLLVFPAWQQLQLVEQQLEDLQAQQQRLPLLRRQLSAIAERRTQAALRQRRILELIQGSGDLRTFLAQLSVEARASGVQLEGYEPLIAPPPAAAGAQGRAAAAPPTSPPTTPAAPPDPLQDPGLSKTRLLLRARGSGPQLQQFLRRLERLSLLVVQSDLSIKVEAPESAAAGKPAAPRAPAALLSLSLSLYGPNTAPAAVKP